MKLSEFKEAVRKVLRERSINAISKLQQKNLDDISKALEYFKKNKHTDKKEPFIKLLKKLGKVKIDLAKATLGEFKYPGNKKYYIYTGDDGSITMYFDPNTATRTYVGIGIKDKDIWVSKVTFD